MPDADIYHSADGQTQQLINDIIAQDFRDKTVLAIAHRLDQICSFDQVIVVNGGRVMEKGNPQELMKQEDSLFRELVFETQDRSPCS